MELTFKELQRDAKAIRASSKFRDAVDSVIWSGYQNACDTYGPRESLSSDKRAEWDYVALGSVRGILSDSSEIDVKVFNWFVRRITI
jgi:hypothetical protein